MIHSFLYQATNARLRYIGIDSLRSSALRSCALKIKILLVFREINATQDHKWIQVYPSVALRSTSINAKGT